MNPTILLRLRINQAWPFWNQKWKKHTLNCELPIVNKTWLLTAISHRLAAVYETKRELQKPLTLLQAKEQLGRELARVSVVYWKNFPFQFMRKRSTALTASQKIQRIKNSTGNKASGMSNQLSMKCTIVHVL